MPAAANTVDAIVARHAARVRDPFNRCRPVSHRLADALRAAGHDAGVLRLSGLKAQAPEADRRWLRLGRQLYWTHYAVVVGDRAIDLTRRQFFPDGAKPHVADRAAYEAEWLEVGPDWDWNERHGLNETAPAPAAVP